MMNQRIEECWSFPPAISWSSAGRTRGLSKRSTNKGSLISGLCAALIHVFVPLCAPAQDPSLRFGGVIPQEVDTIYERGLAWLAANQRDEGDWGGSGQDG